MTHKEFTERTGLKVTEEEYKGVEAIYYAVPNMQKDEFCLWFKKVGANPLVVALANQVNYLTGRIEEQENELDDCHERTDNLVDLLIGKSAAYHDTDFYREAVKLAGQKEVTLRKVLMGLPLWNEDKEYINRELR